MFHKSSKVIWNEPMWIKPDETGNNIAGNIVCSATREDCVNWYKKQYPERNYTDEDALHDFMVANWAWAVEELSDEVFGFQSSDT